MNDFKIGDVVMSKASSNISKHPTMTIGNLSTRGNGFYLCTYYNPLTCKYEVFEFHKDELRLINE